MTGTHDTSSATRNDKVRNWIKYEQEVKKRLASDVRIDDALIEVTVKDEKVILTGTVGSLREKNHARFISWVGGVDSVDAGGLKIEWWARDDMRRKTLFISRTDEEIKNAVENAFLYDPRVSSFNVSVDVSDGTATLNGVVDNLNARTAAEEDAENTIGVYRVLNHLKVRPQIIPSNEELESRVSSAFIQDPYVERFKLDISAFGGTVYLSGKVNTSWEKGRAENIAGRVKGVVRVFNNIDTEYTWKWKPDWQIREDVKDELFWSPFVDEEEVSVTVKDGVVTLTGMVDTYGELLSAKDNAYEGGAKDVMNELTVRYKN